MPTTCQYAHKGVITRITAAAEGILRITRTRRADFLGQTGPAVVLHDAVDCPLIESGEGISFTAGPVTVRVNKRTGALSFLDISEGGYPLERAAQHPMYPSLKFLTAPMNRPVEKIDPIAFGDMLQLARREFDYIFLDAPAGVDAGFRLVSSVADRFLLVTGAGPAAIRDAARVGDLLEIMGKQHVRLIVNRVDKTMLKTVKLTIDDVMDDTGLPLMGLVPEDISVTLAASFGQPVLKYARYGDASRSFRRIAQRIQGFRQPINLR